MLRCPVGWLVGGVLTGLVWPLGAAPGQSFYSAVELVRLPVVVTRSGEPLGQLGPGDFEVLENGERQEVTSFVEGAPGDEMPLHLGLMLDRSGSMQRDLRAAARAAVKLVRTVTEARDVTYVDFDIGVRLGRYRPESYPYLFERIRKRTVGSGTALYEAIARYVQSTHAQGGLHVAVLYSDGSDSRSRITLSEIVGLLRRGDLIMYTIGYLENQRGSGRMLQESVLTRLARETGGEAFFPASAADVDRIASRIAAEVQGRYTLGYQSTDTRRDGRFRRVEVRLTPGRLKDATVRTRSGYLARAARR